MKAINSENRLLRKKYHRLVIESYLNQNFSNYESEYSCTPVCKLYYVDSGKCTFSLLLNSSRATAVKLNKTDYIFIDADVSFKLQTGADCKIFAVEFKALDKLADSIKIGDILDKTLGLKKALTANLYISLTDYGNIRANILRLHNLLNTNRHMYVDHIFTQVLLAELLINIDESYTNTYLNNPYINSVINYIIHNYAEDISIDSISKFVGLNASYLQKIFRVETGTTIYDYLNQFRIEKSLAIIKNTNLSFIDIAVEVGFNNRQSYFNSFKKIMGLSPKLFKKYLSTPVVSFNCDDLTNPKSEY